MAIVADWQPENHNYRLYVPEVGEGVDQAEIKKWHVKVGDFIEPDTPLVDVISGDAAINIQSPVHGRIIARRGQAGDMLEIGKELVMFDADVENEEDPFTIDIGDDQGKKPTASSNKDAQENPDGDTLDCVPMHAELEAGVERDADRREGPGDGIDAPAGRYVKRLDVELVKVRGLSQVMAERMLHSVQTVPHFTYIEEVDVTELESLRLHLNETRRPDQPKITLMPLLIAAAAKAVVDHPNCNARFDEKTGNITRYAALHASIATRTDQGLKMPVLRHTEALDIWGITRGVQHVIAAAKNNTATMDQLGGATLGITSMGRDGGVATTPIINTPEVAIIGLNRVIERPVVYRGKIEIRQMMNLSSSFNHRVVEASEAAAFIQTIKGMLEHPATIFM